MEKNSRNIFTSIILSFLTISLVIPMAHISAVQDLVTVNGLVERADESRPTSTDADRNAEQKSKDPVISDVKTSESESE